MEFREFREFKEFKTLLLWWHNVSMLPSSHLS